jgi:hypothetical protein
MKSDHLEVIAALTEACYDFPMLRVGQIIENAVTSYGGSHGPSEEHPDVFYAEDKWLVAALNWYRETFANRSSGEKEAK